MRILNFTLLIAVTSIWFNAEARNECSERSILRGMQKTTVATPEEDNYDVKGLKFDINLTNTGLTISGNVTTYARTLISNFNVYAFELDTALTIDSVKVNNQPVTITTSANVRRAQIGNALANNTDFTVQVFYHGTAPAGTGQFFTGGLNYVKTPSGTEIMYSLSDDLFAKDWWPCKQSLQDKIDSVTMWVTVDDNLKVASNGLLKNTTTMPGNKLRYEWETKYPIDYYLVAVAVGPFSDYSYYMHYTDGSGDSMLVQNYLFDSSTYMTSINKATFDTTGQIIDYFSKLFGKYPFKDEKYGHCMTALSGGMEHQTMSWLGTSNLAPQLVSHELAHQWWGNSVTYSRWDHVWLSEGFATYAEQLFLEHFDGPQAAKTERTATFGNVLGAANGSVWVDDTTNVGRIFDNRLTYDKGASVAHMLRYLAPEDSLFFVALRAYQQQHKYGNAQTSDLQTAMEQAYNMPLDSFFRQWVYGQGYPTYNVKWAQSGNILHLKFVEGTSHNSVKHFNLPVEVLLKSPTGDTIVKISDADLLNHNIIICNKTINGVVVDPNDEIVNKTGTVTSDPTLLSVPVDMFSQMKVFPNPAEYGWHISGITTDSHIRLYDISGKMVWTGSAASDTYIPAHNLAHGIYILQLNAPEAGTGYFRLVK
ncbi:MAG: T9SS type A sorting domain-containing protein [Chitinophagaceae bacterium]|nr:T9SS type A sorting domain-containing protein [Chitinophagaceae bacterium]MCB9044571.1 T9SS type A sorting domain-containing protein [Chitinophagales bacterium]